MFCGSFMHTVGHVHLQLRVTPIPPGRGDKLLRGLPLHLVQFLVELLG